MDCMFCGKEISKGSKRKKFCSDECKIKFHDRNRGKRHYKLVCDNCGKEYIGTRNRTEKENLKFCSSKCSFDYAKKHNEEKECVICGKPFIPTNSRNMCCSRKCKDMYMNYKKEHTCIICGNRYRTFFNNKYTCSKKCKSELKRRSMVGRIKNGKIKTTMTAPHITIDNILSEIGIEYTNEYVVCGFNMDIHINGTNKNIEVMGKYWHCDIRTDNRPEKYKSLSESVKKDRNKRSIIENNGNKILYLWEIDIDENPEMCKELIKEFVENKELKSYQSSSYLYSELGGLIYNPYAKKQLMEETTLND